MLSTSQVDLLFSFVEVLVQTLAYGMYLTYVTMSIDVSRAGAFIAIIPIAAHSLRYYMLPILYRENCVHTFVANKGSAYDRMS